MNGVKALGHSVHPMLIVFPLGVLGMAVIFDIVTLVTNQTGWSTAADYMIVGGVLSGLLAAVFGFIDWLAIPANTRARRVGAWHGITNVVVVGLFAVSWWLRRGHADAPGNSALALSFAGLVLALLSGWLGGELVERLGMGVDSGAHANSPSSLSGRPANADRSEPMAAD
jgi:uncharacterized membrane protein